MSVRIRGVPEVPVPSLRDRAEEALFGGAEAETPTALAVRAVMMEAFDRLEASGFLISAALVPVAEERRRQDEKWGDQSGLPAGTWLAILGEEFGEVAERALALQLLPVIDRDDETPGRDFDAEVRVLREVRQGLHDELIQVAAVAVAWAEGLRRGGAA